MSTGFHTVAPAPPRSTARPALEYQWLGAVPYGNALDLQAHLVADRRANHIPDQLLLLEHPHVITLGTSSSTSHVLLTEEERRLFGIELFETGRGGDVTYHGPGQLVGYPIVDLKPDRCDLHRYIRDLEEVLIRCLKGYDITPTRSPGLTGVWVDNDKIAAIGVRVSSGWITSHGFALNVGTDLHFFDAIVPCGIRGKGVTSIERCTGHSVSLESLSLDIAMHFAEVFERELAFASANTSRRG